MLRIRFCIILFLLLPAPGQTPPEPLRDGLGRSTPRGTVLGFLSAAHRQDYLAAAQFLDTPLQGTAAEELSNQLSVVLDRGLPANLYQLSTQPEGERNSSLPPGKELVGVIQTAEGSFEVLLEHVNRPNGMIWLFSTETLKRVPDVYNEVNSSLFEKYVPGWLARFRWFSIPLWQWLALIIGLVLAVGVSGGLRRIAAPVLSRLLRPLVGEQDNHLLDLLTAPLRVLVLLGVVQITVLLLKLPLMARHIWAMVSSTLLILAGAWLMVRAVRICAKVAGRRLQRTGKEAATSVVRLIQWTVTFVVVSVAAVILLRNAGFDVTAVLAGLGIGGIALAFAAQKTLENLFGGVSIIFDKPIRVGDLCRIGDREGRVEDIGLRSTRFRTHDRSILTVPNGQLSVMNLENFGMRDKMWFRHIVGLRSETASHQLNRVLTGLRGLLAANSTVETTTARVRVVKLGPYSIDVEVFAYVLTGENERFLEIQEELLTGVLGIIERSGTGIALPAQVVYANRDPIANRDPASQSRIAEEPS